MPATSELRLEQLVDVTGQLAGAHTLDAVARIAVDIGIGAVGASYGALWLRTPGEAALDILGGTKHGPSLESWRRLPLDSDTPVAEAMRTGTAILIPTLADYEARFPASFARIQDTITSSDSAYAMLPLGDAADPLGVLALTYERGLVLAREDKSFLAILGRQCGIAVARVRAAEAQLRARIEAEEATRSREDIISVVSHDLRNPLGTIIMGASTLVSAVEGDDPKLVKLRGVAERMQRQAERMARMIGDLVDFSAIVGNRFTVYAEPTSATSLISGIAAALDPLAAERGIPVETGLDGDVPNLSIERGRIVQLAVVVGAAALKVAPRTSRFAVRIAPTTGGAVLAINLPMPALTDEDLTHLFDRAWRSTASGYAGAGLAFTIARGIAQAHGGDARVIRAGDGVVGLLVSLPAAS